MCIPKEIPKYYKKLYFKFFPNLPKVPSSIHYRNTTLKMGNGEGEAG